MAKPAFKSSVSGSCLSHGTRNIRISILGHSNGPLAPSPLFQQRPMLWRTALPCLTGCFGDDFEVLEVPPTGQEKKTSPSRERRSNDRAASKQRATDALLKGDPAVLCCHGRQAAPANILCGFSGETCAAHSWPMRPSSWNGSFVQRRVASCTENQGR